MNQSLKSRVSFSRVSESVKAVEAVAVPVEAVPEVAVAVAVGEVEVHHPRPLRLDSFPQNIRM